MHLPGDMNEQLGALAKRDGVSVSEIIRRMIAQGLASQALS
jgi:predicted DNA-binding protein